MALAGAARAASATDAGSAAVPPAGSGDVGELAREHSWLTLLHYEPRAFGSGYRSQVDVPGFFLASGGRDDPAAELAAAIRVFRSGRPRLPAPDPDPRCAFPARFRWVSAHVSGPWAAVPCPQLEAWRTGLAAVSATLVFSTAYEGNPASMFGHTFLRLNAAPAGAAALDARASGLLGYGVSYGAAVTDWNPLIYALYGLTGGFQGTFNLEPYYVKVREYGAGENRDLWEYDLGLSPPAVSRLVDHLWELLSFGAMPYYFLDANCSYQVLAWLEAAAPEWDLTNHLGFPVTPADTVRRIARMPHGITAVAFRPAERKRVIQALAVLTSDERDQVERLVHGDEAPGPVTGQHVLDAAIARLDFDKAAAKGQLPAPVADRLRQVLAARARAPDGGSRPAAAIDQGNRPDLGHGEHAVGTYAAWDGAAGYGIDGRVGYHDLLDDSTGHERYFGLDYVGAAVDYRPLAHQVDVSRLTVFDATALAPFRRWDPRPAWKIGLSASRDPVAGCARCRHGDLAGSLGLSTELGGPALLAYGMADLGLSYSDAYGGSPGTVTPGLRAGLLTNVWSWHKALVEVVRNRPVSTDGAVLAAATTVTVEQALFPDDAWRVTNGLTWVTAGSAAVHGRAGPSVRAGLERHF